MPWEPGHHPGGRPTKYDPRFALIAKEMCQLGATDADLAAAFDCSTQTINLWKSTHKEFSDAIKVGKSPADDRVEHSLYQRAVGYSYDAVKIFCKDGEETLIPYQEHVPPDVAAAFIWLKNRRKEEWRDKPLIETTNPETGEVTLSEPDGDRHDIAIHVHFDGK